MGFWNPRGIQAERAKNLSLNQVNQHNKKITEAANKDAYNRGFEENQGKYLVSGTIYRPSKLSSLNYVCSTIVTGVELLLLYRSIILISDNLPLLFETTYWAVLITGIFSGFSATLPQRFQSRFSRIFTTLGKGIYSYTLIDEDTAQEIQKLRSKGEKEKDILKKVFTILGLAGVFGFVVILPGYAMYSGKFFEPQRSDGVVEGLPVVLWVPVDVDDDKILMLRICLTLTQFYIAHTTVNMIIAIVSFEICVGHTLMYEFKVLALAIRTFDKRAVLTANNEHQQTEWNARLKLSMKDAIRHHEVLLEIVEDYVGVFYVVMLIFLVTTTGMMCLSAISLYSDIPFGSKVLFFVLTISELSNTFVLCCYGQILLDAHELVRRAIYDCNWTKYSNLIGKHVQITLTRTQKPLSLTVGGFAEVNLDTWTQVIKTAFSYFSILQALK